MKLVAQSTLDELWERHIYMGTVMRSLGVETPKEAVSAVVELQALAREARGIEQTEVAA